VGIPHASRTGTKHHRCKLLILMVGDRTRTYYLLRVNHEESDDKA
jgi:hypothetical protein